MAQVRLLVERGGVQAERVNHVVDLNGTILNTLLNLLSRCVGTGVCIPALTTFLILLRHVCIRTDFDSAEGNHVTVDLVDGTIDLLQVVTVGDDLVTGDDILRLEFAVSQCFPPHIPNSTLYLIDRIAEAGSYHRIEDWG